MKKFVHVALISTALLSQSSAWARSVRPSAFEAQLTRIHLDPRLGYNRVVTGSVQVNYDSGEATLTLHRAWHCPPGRFCAAVMPAPVQIQLPVVKMTARDRCGIVKMVARRDRRAADGALETLVIRDTRGNTCPHLRALAPTEVEYRTKSSGMGGSIEETFSSFEGDELRPRF